MKLVVLVSILLLGLLLAGCNPVRPMPTQTSGEATATIEAPAEAPAESTDAAAGVAAILARQLGVDSSDITIVSSEAVEWPDACLGVTLEGEMCAQVITPGHKIVLSVGGDTYTYHTDQNALSVRLAEGPEPQAGAAEAVGGQSLAGMLYEGPAELGQAEPGSADSSRCAKLRISTDEATVWACEGTVTTAPLSENLAATWEDLSDRFGRFVYETPSERLDFQGMGVVDDEIWQRALLAWARVTRAELATGQTSATARTALSWQLGAVADTPEACAHLTVLDYGYAYAEQRACESGELVSSTEDWLNQEEMQQFDRWLYAYAPLYVEDNYLNGVGQDQMPEDEAGAVHAWAEELWTRVAGMPIGPANAATGSASGSTVGSAGGAACDDTSAGGEVYSNAEYGFCMGVPDGYSVVETAPGGLSLVAGGDIMNHISPRVGIEVSGVGDRTLAGIADQMMQEYAPVGMNVTPQAITVDGVEAVLLDNLPGQDLNRRVVVVHNGLVYSIMFTPLSPEAEPFYQSVLASLRFLN